MVYSSINTIRQLQYNYSIDMDKKIIYVKVKGNIIESEGAEMGLFFRTKALELDCKLYFDMTETHNSISMGSVYFWFEHQYGDINEKFRFINTAYKINDEQDKLYDFIQTVCFNQGIRTRVFKTENEAIEWLMSK